MLVSLNHARLSHAWIAHKNELEEKVVGFVTIWEDVGSHILGSEITPDGEGLSLMSKNRYSDYDLCFWFATGNWFPVNSALPGRAADFGERVIFRHSTAVFAGSSSAKTKRRRQL